jgi:hypothetical protein
MQQLFRNVGKHYPSDTASHPRRHEIYILCLASLITRAQVPKRSHSFHLTYELELVFSPANCCRNANPLRPHNVLHKQNVLSHLPSVKYHASLFFLAVFITTGLVFVSDNNLTPMSRLPTTTSLLLKCSWNWCTKWHIALSSGSV